MTAKPLQTKKFVRWDALHSFEERRIRYTDWVLLGAPELEEANAVTAADTVWTLENKWEVPRSVIPLTDAQLAEFLAVEGKFKLVEK